LCRLPACWVSGREHDNSPCAPGPAGQIKCPAQACDKLSRPLPSVGLQSILRPTKREAQNPAHYRSFRVSPLPQVIERTLGSRRLFDGRQANGPLLPSRVFAFKRGCLRSLHKPKLAHDGAAVTRRKLAKDCFLLPSRRLAVHLRNPVPPVAIKLRRSFSPAPEWFRSRHAIGKASREPGRGLCE